MNQSHQTDFHILLLEVLSDTRLQAIIMAYSRLTSHNKRLALRIIKGLQRT